MVAQSSADESLRLTARLPVCDCGAGDGVGGELLPDEQPYDTRPSAAVATPSSCFEKAHLIVFSLGRGEASRKIWGPLRDLTYELPDSGGGGRTPCPVVGSNPGVARKLRNNASGE